VLDHPAQPNLNPPQEASPWTLTRPRHIFGPGVQDVGGDRAKDLDRLRLGELLLLEQERDERVFELPLPEVPDDPRARS
jgi:hypothetical protein